MGKTFICEMCKEKCEKGWSDEEANKEAEKYFGVKNASSREDFAIICDDCYEKIHPETHPEEVNKARKELGTL